MTTQKSEDNKINVASEENYTTPSKSNENASHCNNNFQSQSCENEVAVTKKISNLLNNSEIQIKPNETKFLTFQSEIEGILETVREPLDFVPTYIQKGENKILIANKSKNSILLKKHKGIGKVHAATPLTKEDLSQCDNIKNILKIEFSNLVERVETLKQEISGFEDYSHDEREVIMGWLRDYPDVFSLDSDPLGFYDGMPMELDTGDNPPVFVKPYRLPLGQTEEINKVVDEWLEQGVINHSTSSYNSSHWTAKKRWLF